MARTAQGKNIILALVAVFACAFLACAYLYFYSPYPKLGGRITYAFGKSTSNAVFVQADDYVSGTEFFGYKAVSAFYPLCDRAAAEEEISKLIYDYSAKEVYRETADGTYCVYYYSEKLPFYKVLYIGDASQCTGSVSQGAEKEQLQSIPQTLLQSVFSRSAVKVNIHVAYSSCGITVGCPLIYGGF
ncbi:MAG: hypothetical protein SO373_04665 [Candidatus Borkfalkiaceae bacterium]|nr:hypothetical protein [Christensenellaceae bacterium]